MLKTKLSFHDRLDRVRFVIKTKQDNDVTDHTRVGYTENETKLFWPIGPGVACDEN